jgi:hypothetical protein
VDLVLYLLHVSAELRKTEECFIPEIPSVLARNDAQLSQSAIQQSGNVDGRATLGLVPSSYIQQSGNVDGRATLGLVPSSYIQQSGNVGTT